MSVAFLLLVLLAAVAVGWAVLVFRYAGSKDGRERDGGPRCGACGYDVRGAASLECPECGADLRYAGILPPHLRLRSRGLSTGGKIVLWLLFVAVVAGATSAMLAATVLPRVQTMQMSHRLRSPQSQTYLGVRIESVAERTVLPMSPQRFERLRGATVLSLELSDGTLRELQVDANNARWRPVVSPESPWVAQPFTAADLERFYADAGLDPADERVAAEIVAVCQGLNGVVAGKLISISAGSSSSSRSTGGSAFSSAGSSSSGSSGTSGLASGLVVLAWLVLAMIGAVRIARRDAGRQAGLKSSTASDTPHLP